MNNILPYFEASKRNNMKKSTGFMSAVFNPAITATSNRIVKEARYLSIGDVLQTGDIVTHAPYRGLKTPTGKIDLGINGFKKTWNARTEIAIKNI